MSYRIVEEGLTFDDVLLIFKYSDIESRSDIDVSINLGELKLMHPIIPANMKSIIGREMVNGINESGGLAILHRFMPIEEQLKIAEDVLESFGHNTKFAVSIGIKDVDRENLYKFREVGVDTICIDIAHGHSLSCINMVKWIRKEFPKLLIIAGNVATGAGAEALWDAGADVVKVGIGGGSLCTTRIETGNGVPQLTALMDVHRTQQTLLRLDYTRPGSRGSYPFISDGGLKKTGDIVKALCFADMVMCGNMFAGCEEVPGRTMDIDGICYKEYEGSSTHKANHVEGVSALVPCKGKYQDILEKILEGLRSGVSYQGGHNLADLKKNPHFVRITNSSLIESHPHDVRVIK